jgi:hypothetical protein
MAMNMDARETSTSCPTDMASARTGVGILQTVRRPSWGSIIAGTAVAITSQLFFATLGAGIGLAALDSTAADARSLGVGAGIYWLITGLISLFAGGFVAGRLAAFVQPADSALHGVLVWSVAGVIGMFMLTTTAAALVGGSFAPLARTMDSRDRLYAPRGLTYSTDDLAWRNRVAEQTTPVSATDRESGTGRPSNTASTPDTTVPPNTAGSSGSPERDTNTTSRSPALDRDTDGAARAAAKASLWSALGLILGALAAGLGAVAGRPRLVVSGERTV